LPLPMPPHPRSPLFPYTTLFRSQGVQTTPGQRKALYRALELLAASPSRTLTDFVNTLQDHELRDGLNHYTLAGGLGGLLDATDEDRKSTRLNSSHQIISYAVFCL